MGISGQSSLGKEGGPLDYPRSASIHFDQIYQEELYLHPHDSKHYIF